jgi:hypothetical protein
MPNRRPAARSHFVAGAPGFMDSSSSAPSTRPAASRARAWVPTPCPSRSWVSAPPGCVERSASALLVVPRELEVIALARHAALDGADSTARVEPRVKRRARGDPRLTGAALQRDEWKAAEAVGHSNASQIAAIISVTATGPSALCVRARARPAKGIHCGNGHKIDLAHS